MANKVLADELEKEIVLMQQELLLKRKLLTECREKLSAEISEHVEDKLMITKLTNEIKELKLQLDVSLKSSQKLEEENNKNREGLVKLQVQQDAYIKERELLVENCHQMSAANSALKSENSDLKEKLQRHLSFEDKYKERQLETSKVIDEILSKQETLNKEQHRLEAASKEALQFATKITEEAEYQARFVREADLSHRKMEEKMIQLISVLKELEEKNKAECFKNNSPDENTNYVEEWKLYKQEVNLRTEHLLEQNKKLMEELNFANSQIDLLMKNYPTKNT